MAVEKRPARGGQGKGVEAGGFVAGHARLAILPAAKPMSPVASCGPASNRQAARATDAFQG
jgi:hypothetical protein